MRDCIIANNCINKNKLFASGMSDKLVNCIEIISRMYSEREKEITLFDCIVCICDTQKYKFILFID